MGLPKTEIKALVSSLSGIPLDLVIWAGDPLPNEGPRGGVLYGTLTLNANTIKGVGIDDVRATSGPSSITYEQRADRIVTISMRYEALGDEEAFDALERVRTRIRWSTSHATLLAANLALVETLDVTTYNGRRDNRDVSVAQLDVRLNWTSSDTPPADTFVETVTGTAFGKTFTVP